jgi:excinuclease UvrABC nuclease subunit
MNNEITRILEILQDDFATCHALTGTFSNLPNLPGIYAIRQGDTILYIGKGSSSVRKRFQGGHTALVKVLIDGIPASELRIAVATVAGQSIRDLAKIEARLLQRIHPPYNVQYPSIED